MTTENRWPTVSRRRIAVHAVAVAIAIYGGLLRLDAFVGKYGALDHPAWARIATHTIAPIGAALRPSRVHWTPETTPYVGGDPITYIEYGREMTSFYQSHVREPVFRALTHASLWALDDQDVGVSLASAIGSTLAIYATFLVGAALLTPATGLVAALLAATELEMVSWAVDGWRDDTFTATILFSVWALLRLRRRPSFGNALLVGVTCGLSCLTRITALTFIIPALVWLLIEQRRNWREHGKAIAAAAVMAVAIVAPYLVNCAIATGDPLISINYHTAYYRFAEDRPIDKPMSAAEYLRGKFVERPIRTLDTGINGLFLQPFVTKWRGFEDWIHGAGLVLRALAVVGLCALPFFGAGRLLLVVLLGSLLPYIFTWNIGGGNAWRFTMHAYPFFFLAVGVALTGAAVAGRTIVRRSVPMSRATLLPLGVKFGVVVAVAALGVTWYFGFPWYVVQEAIASGESTSIETGERDEVFYRHGWSAPHLEGITVRVSRAERPIVRFPLPQRRAYDLVLRLDPATPTLPEEIDVLFNRHLIGRFHLTWNAERVGSYRVRLREDIVNAGSNELIIVPSGRVTAGSAGAKFEWLDAAERIGVRLWYVRVLP